MAPKIRQRSTPFYSVLSTENLTNFFGEDVSGSCLTSRDGRLCDDGMILVTFEKRRGAKNELRRPIRSIAEDGVVDVDVDTFVNDGVVDVGVDNDEIFFSAGFGGSTVARERWVSGFAGSSDDIDRPSPLVDLRCGVRDKCRPIDICSTVGRRPARSS